MPTSRRAATLRSVVAPTYSVPDLVAVALLAAVVAVWTQAAGGSFSLAALLACALVFLSFYLVGSLVAGWRSLAQGAPFDLPLRLLVGYAVVNTALFGLAWLSPLGILANFGIVLAIAAGLFFAARPARKQSEDTVGFLVLALAVVATTLWCQDSLRPMAIQGDDMVVKPWVDSFYHAVHIRIFGASHGWRSIEDFRMAGVPARLYHYGCYLTPAVIQRASGMHPYTAFAGILAPLGVLLTGLAAYALVASFWGAWAGLAGCAALLLLPDGAQQGMQNTFMSYHWLTQISPSATYGLALLAVAWLFVILGCRQGSRLQVLAGWLTGAIVLAYKAHFFIASSFLLLMVPALFFSSSLGVRKRAAWAVASIALYGAAIAIVQKVPGVPPIRFDGSCVGKILRLVISFAQPGALRNFIADRMGTDHGVLANLLYGVPYIALATFGLFAPVAIVLALRLGLRRRKDAPALHWLFPLLLMANFLAMFFGLALDFDSSTPDELSHRPVMIVYFAVMAWMGGASAVWLLEARRLGRYARPALLGLAVVLMAVPAHFGSGVHRLWAMRNFSGFPLPLGLVRAAEYIRDHGDAQDVFQDSQFDRVYIVAALAERRTYAARTLTIMPYHRDVLDQRIENVEKLMQVRHAMAVVASARTLGIRWFLLKPGDRVNWPPEVTDRPAFALDGYRLFRF